MVGVQEFGGVEIGAAGMADARDETSWLRPCACRSPCLARRRRDRRASRPRLARLREDDSPWPQSVRRFGPVVLGERVVVVGQENLRQCWCRSCPCSRSAADPSATWRAFGELEGLFGIERRIVLDHVRDRSGNSNRRNSRRWCARASCASGRVRGARSRRSCGRRAASRWRSRRCCRRA